jgi:hypothetical protein
MKRVISGVTVLFPLLMLSLNLAGQQNASIYGTITSATTGQPIQGSVSANAVGFSGPYGQGSGDARGNYSLSVPPGAYRVSASCGECSAQLYGQKGLTGTGKLLPLKAGERVRIDFRMPPPSVITGRVVDEDGDPLSRVAVQLYNYRFGARGDKGELLGGTPFITDDRGAYRIVLYAGGEYVVGIQGRLGYPPLFYPDTADPDQAQAIAVRAGAEVSNIDFKRKRIRGVTVRGVVTSPGAGQQPIEVFATRSGKVLVSLGDPVVRSFANADGTFEIRNLLPGVYEVSAVASQGSAGSVSIQVRASDLNDVKIALQQLVPLRGRVSAKVPIVPPFSLDQITLTIGDSEGRGGSQARVGSDGAFTFTPIRPGSYRFSVYGLRNGNIESATLGTQNALGDFAVTNAGDPLDLVIGFDTGRAEVIVRDSSGAPYPGAFVAFIAEPPRRGRTDSTFSAGTDSEGKATLTGIAPGAYEVFAWEEQPRVYAGDLFNRQYLNQFEGKGTRVRVEPNATVESQVRIILSP